MWLISQEEKGFSEMIVATKLHVDNFLPLIQDIFVCLQTSTGKGFVVWKGCVDNFVQTRSSIKLCNTEIFIVSTYTTGNCKIFCARPRNLCSGAAGNPCRMLASSPMDRHIVMMNHPSLLDINWCTNVAISISKNQCVKCWETCKYGRGVWPDYL